MTDETEDSDDLELFAPDEIPDDAGALQCGRVVGPDGYVIGRIDWSQYDWESHQW